MGKEFFTEVTEPIRFGGLGSADPLTYKVYEPDRHRPRQADGGAPPDRRLLLALLRLGGHRHVRARDVRPAVDRRGGGRDGRRPHEDGGSVRVLHEARRAVLLLPRPRRRPRGRNASPSSRANLDALADDALGYQERTGVRLLWGTANLFSHPRYQAGAATNPDPEVFAYAAAQVKHMLEVTQRLGGTNYVLWGGREGYDTLLNTDLRREGDQLGPLPAPRRRAQAQDRLRRARSSSSPSRWSRPSTSTTTTPRPSTASSSATASTDEYRLNIEANHATLAGHSFHHEVAYAVANGMFGSIDANRGDPQNGWDTDQFPNSVEELSLPLYEILRGGGFTTGGFNFDAKLRRQSMRPRPTSSTPTSAASTRSPGRSWSPRRWSRTATWRRSVDARYAGWDGELGTGILGGTPQPGRPRREGRRPARSTRSRSPGSQELLRERRQPAHLVGGRPRLRPGAPAVGDHDGPRPRHRRVDDGDQGDPHRRGRCRSRRSASSTTSSSVPRPLWSEQDPRLWWDGDSRGDPRGAR